MKRVIKVCLALLVVGVGALLLVWVSSRGNSRTFPALPSPNGYDDFVSAGNLLGNETGDAYKMDIEQLRALIATNSEPLRLLQLGLTRTCSVHTAECLTNTAGLALEFSALRRVAQFETAIGRLAELEGRTNDAVAAYLVGMRFGNEISRGGLVIHGSLGVACEAMARSYLTTVATNLDATDVQVIILVLEKMEAESVSWAEIADNERMFKEVIRQFSNPIDLVQAWLVSQPILKKAKLRHLSELARRRLLIAELALRSHVVTLGGPPKQLDDLVPKYLARVPLDPFTDRALIYRLSGTNWLLYSLGANRVDDGGAPPNRTAGGKSASDDLRYDTP